MVELINKNITYCYGLCFYNKKKNNKIRIMKEKKWKIPLNATLGGWLFTKLQNKKWELYMALRSQMKPINRRYLHEFQGRSRACQKMLLFFSANPKNDWAKLLKINIDDN